MRTCLLVAALASMLPAGKAEAAFVLWQGQARVALASSACVVAGDPRRSVRVGDTIRAIYRPRLLGTNGNDTRVSFIPDSQATWLAILAGGAVPGGVMTAFGSDFSGRIRANEGGAYRGLRQLPTTVTDTTPVVDVQATFDNFLFLPGCTVVVRAVFARRDD